MERKPSGVFGLGRGREGISEVRWVRAWSHPHVCVTGRVHTAKNTGEIVLNGTQVAIIGSAALVCKTAFALSAAT
jgi:hypothetical protein